MKASRLFKPYVSLRSYFNVIRVLRSGQLAEGPEVKKLEREFEQKFNARHAVALNSGTSALELAFKLTGIEEGDEVITPILTCTATNLPLVHLKAKIVFADVDYSLNLDPEDVLRKITPKTKAIVFVHLGGDATNLRRISEIAREKQITLIEDGAQSLGGQPFHDGRFTCVSLQAVKAITAGDGGILLCRDREDSDRAKRLRWFGYDRERKQRLGDDDLVEAGYKYHMSDVSAAIARGNLADYEKIVSHREKLMQIYAKLNGLNGNFSYSGFTVVPSIWATKVIDVHRPWSAKADETKEGWKQILEPVCEIGQYHFRNDKYSVFKPFKPFKSATPVMDEIENNYFFLPMHMGVSERQAQRIVDTIAKNIL